MLIQILFCFYSTDYIFSIPSHLVYSVKLKKVVWASWIWKRARRTWQDREVLVARTALSAAFIRKELEFSRFHWSRKVLGLCQQTSYDIMKKFCSPQEANDYFQLVYDLYWKLPEIPPSQWLQTCVWFVFNLKFAACTANHTPLTTVLN